MPEVWFRLLSAFGGFSAKFLYFYKDPGLVMYNGFPYFLVSPIVRWENSRQSEYSPLKHLLVEMKNINSFKKLI